MYIEFTLPNLSNNASTAWIVMILNHELDSWSKQYNIPYKTKIFKLTKRVTFDDEKNYSFFAMTWNPRQEAFKEYFTNYRLIEPMSRV